MDAHEPEPDTALVALIDREQAPLLARRFYGEGPASPITASLAQVPELLELTLPFIAAALGPAGLDERAKEIAVPAHVRAARVPLLRRDPHCGRARHRARERRGPRPARGTADREHLSDPRDLTMIEWIDAVALGPGTVEPAVRARASGALEDHALVELTLTVAATLMLNRYCTALGLPTGVAALERLAEEGFA